jgi:hypothetical protein
MGQIFEHLAQAFGGSKNVPSKVVGQAILGQIKNGMSKNDALELFKKEIKKVAETHTITYLQASRRIAEGFSSVENIPDARIQEVVKFLLESKIGWPLEWWLFGGLDYPYGEQI